MQKSGFTLCMGAVALGTLVAPLIAYAQGGPGNEINHGQHPTGRGDRVRGASPPQAAGAITTGNGINYNGGPVMHPVNLYYILYGNWSGLDSTGPAILQTWGQNIAPSPYFNINSTYGDSTGNVPNLVTFEGTYIDAGSLGNSLDDNGIAKLTSNAINHGFAGTPNTPGVVDPNGLYMVLTAPGVQETTGFLTSYCGWHWTGSFVNGAVQAGYLYSGYPATKFAFIGNAAGPSFFSCAVQSTSPNGDAGADAMISVMAHELSEAVSDPQLDGWYASNGEENGDLCAWNFGTTSTLANGARYNVTLNGGRYLMQQIWLNAQGGKCALSYSGGPDFTLSGSPASQTVTPGGSTDYTVTLGALGGYTGNVTLSLAGTPPTGVFATFGTNPVTGGSGSSTMHLLASGTPAGSYTLTVQGTDGVLTHTTTVTLNVADFTITPSPSTRSIGEGSNTTYSVALGAVGGFSSTVGLSLSGLPSGATAGFTPASVTTSGSSTLNITGGTAATGTYPLTITGTAGTGQVHSAGVSLTITASDFTISASPASQSAGSGNNNVPYSVTVGSVGGFSSNVAFSITGLPQGASGSFSPASVNGSGASTLTVNTGTAATGTYPLTITGTSSTHVHSTSVSLTITAADFTITASPANPSTKQGLSATPQVTIAALNGFTGSVALSITSPLPAGLTASFSPASITNSGSSVLTLTPNGTPAGTYNVAVTGTSGVLSHSANLTLTVTLGGSIAITANPTTVSVSASKKPSGSTTITVTSSNGFAGNVALSASGLPGGGTASFSPTTVSVSPGHPGTATLTLSVSSNTKNGNNNITVTGNSGAGGPQGQTKVSLQVTR
jgi:hypothetical protein